MDLGNNPYTKKIFEKTKLAEVKNLITASCVCKIEEEYYNGAAPEYYDNFKKAAFRFHFHKTMKTLFWGVHYRGKHIVGIKD